MKGLLAVAEITIEAPRDRVWIALTDPVQIKQYMFGSDVEANWEVGEPIRWKGEWQGKSYEDKGEVIEVVKPLRLSVTHFSPLSGAEDRPENYHTIVYELAEHDGNTELRLTQDGNASEQEAVHAKENWMSMLDGLKRLVADA